MDPVRSLFRWATIAASALVVLGFAFFAAGEAREGTSTQIARVDGAGPLPAADAEADREQANGALREFVDDANDVLLAPFEGVVSSGDAWVANGVPALLALLVYGVGGMTLVNYALPSRR